MEDLLFFDFYIGVAGAVMVLASFVLSKAWADEQGDTIFQSLNVAGGLFLFVHALFIESAAYIVLSIIFTFVSVERLGNLINAKNSSGTEGE